MIHATYPSLAQKRVIITGGGTGIGIAIVEAFARQGAHVTFIDIAKEASGELEKKLASLPQPPVFRYCDLTDLAQLADVFADIEKKQGPTDILVNNAANDDRHQIADVTPAYWDERIAVNLRHQFFCAQAVLPAMKKKGAGAIINLGSISWHLATGNMAIYMTAKAGIEGLTRGIARDYGPYGVRANCIIPGAVRTPRQELLWHTPEAEKVILDGQCLKLRVDPDDVAALALFLASDNAAKCTGRGYFVDAGWFGAAA